MVGQLVHQDLALCLHNLILVILEGLIHESNK